jgi:hypothetical protein
MPSGPADLFSFREDMALRSSSSSICKVESWSMPGCGGGSIGDSSFSCVKTDAKKLVSISVFCHQYR